MRFWRRKTKEVQSYDPEEIVVKLNGTQPLGRITSVVQTEKGLEVNFALNIDGVRFFQQLDKVQDEMFKAVSLWDEEIK